MLQCTAMRTAAIVLAAGEGRRMGRPKALLPIHDTTFLGHVCRTFAAAGVDLTVAVLGAEAESVRSAGTLPGGVRVVVNERWRDGMLSSLLLGLEEADSDGADAVLVHPVDTPLVSKETVLRVADALGRGHPIVVPSHADRRGHPAGFGRAVFAELRAAPPEQGARAILGRDAARVAYVEGDAGCVAGIDTPEDYRRLLGDGRP